MKIRNKIISVVVPLIVIPLIFIAILSTETAKIGITKIAKQLLSYKLEDFYKQVSSQYDILYSTGLIQNKEFVDKAFTQIEEYAKKLKLSETGYIQVFKSDGTILISPVNKGENIKDTQFFKTMLDKKNGWIEYTFNGEPRVGIFLYFAGWDWYLLISENEKKFYSDANKIQLQIIYIGSVTIILVLIVLSLITSSITNPIRSLMLTMKEIIKTHNLKKKAEVIYADEIGELSISFNIMTGALDSAYNQVKNYAYEAIVARDNEKRVRTVFQKYVPKEVVNQMLQIKDKNASLLIGQKQFCSILFSDIRDFTTISESMEADQLVNSLNQYFNGMVKRIVKNNGIVDKFIGDAIMAVFGAPVKTDDDTKNAVESAFEMLEALNEFNEPRKKEGKVIFRIGIGIASGDVIAGNIGSEQKMDYTVIGDPVNTASRLEGLTKVYKVPIIITDVTCSKVKDFYFMRELDLIRPKGKKHPIAIYQPVKYLTDDLENSLKFFNEGLKWYKDKIWEKAIPFFEKAYSINEDGPSIMYIDRCKHYIENPPPEDWDGVYIFKTK